MQRSLADENYLKAVYHLSGGEPVSVTTGLLAEYLNVTAASVTDKMKRLKEKGYLEYQKSRGVMLSREGRKIALSVIRKHRLWEQFLVQVLKFKWNEIHEIAEQLEHIDSDELIERIDKFLGHPTVDPHGDPIPDEKGKMEELHLQNLAETGVGTSVSIAAVANHDAEFLKFLDKKGLTLSRKLTVKNREAYDGTLTLWNAEKKPVVLSEQVARQIWIRKL
ncbi:MAG: metal-dependent transcriptional regulator [Chitinophagaceae bacterium]